MFELPSTKITHGTFHRFHANEHILERDSDLVLLSTGTNESNAHVISSFLTYDDDTDCAMYFHAIVSAKTYLGFISGSITLRDVLLGSSLLFIVEKDSSGKELRAWNSNVDDIPEKYRPLEGSFCPSIKPSASLVYTAELTGGKANEHLLSKDAFTSVVNGLVEFFLESTRDLLDGLRLQIDVMLRPPSIASFEMEFVLDVKPIGGSGLFAHSEDLDVLLKSIYAFMLKELPGGGSKIDTQSIAFAALREQAKRVYKQQFVIEPGDIDEVITTSIKKSLPILAELDFGDQFNEVLLRNEVGDVKVEVGVVDSEYIQETRDLVDSIALESADDVLIDTAETKYNVQVFYFNRESGNGAAYYMVDDDVTKIKVYARGLDSYENTKFSHSLDTGKRVTVDGIGKRVNGVLKSVTVQLKPVIPKKRK